MQMVKSYVSVLDWNVKIKTKFYVVLMKDEVIVNCIVKLKN